MMRFAHQLKLKAKEGDLSVFLLVSWNPYVRSRRDKISELVCRPNKGLLTLDLTTIVSTIIDQMVALRILRTECALSQ